MIHTLTTRERRAIAANKHSTVPPLSTWTSPTPRRNVGQMTSADTCYTPLRRSVRGGI